MSSFTYLCTVQLIALTDKVLIVHLNLHLDVSEGIYVVHFCMEKLFSL